LNPGHSFSPAVQIAALPLDLPAAARLALTFPELA
jgi:hypothetical protein